MPLSQGLGVLLALPVSRFDEARGQTEDEFTVRQLRQVLAHKGLVGVLSAYLMLWIVGYIVSSMTVRLGSYVSTRVYQSLRGEAFENALRYGVSLPDPNNLAGQASWSISRGGEMLWSFVADSLPLLVTLVTLGTAFYIMATKSLPACGICLFAIFLRAWLSRMQARQLKDTRQSLERSRNQLAASTDDLLSRRELILIHEQTGKYAGKIADMVSTYGKSDRKIAFWENHYDTLGDVSKEFGLLLLLLGLLWLTVGVRTSAPSATPTFL